MGGGGAQPTTIRGRRSARVFEFNFSIALKSFVFFYADSENDVGFAIGPNLEHPTGRFMKKNGVFRQLLHLGAPQSVLAVRGCGLAAGWSFLVIRVRFWRIVRCVIKLM